MRIWKKAFSAAVSAALIASLTASGAFALKAGSDSGSDQTDILDCLNAIVHTATTCSQVADGISTVGLVGDTADGDDGVAGGHTTYISASGATIIAAGGQFVLGGGIVTAPVNADINDLTDTITLRAPSTAGSAVVSVYQISTTTGIATLEGTLTITFTASSGLDVSVSKSVVKILDDCNDEDPMDGNKVSTFPASPADEFAAYLCVRVMDGNGNPVVGAVATGTITPVGLLDGESAYGQTNTATTDADGIAWLEIYSSGLPGLATIGLSVKSAGKTTAFAPVTFTFSGDVATITAASEVLVVYFDGGSDDAVSFTAKDAAGNKVPVDGDDTASSNEDIFEISDVSEYDGVDDGLVEVTCVDVGSATVTVEQDGIKSNAVTVYCSDWADSFSIAFDKTTVAPAGSATATVSVLDENGQPAANDGEDICVIVSSGAVNPACTDTWDGSAAFTFLAPFNTGVATALATVQGITGSKTAQINVGAVVPAVTSGTNASALGVTTAGPFSATTKVAALGKYQTFKLSFGAGAAGSTVGILVATKNAAGVWSSFTRVTGRVADASGNVYYYVRNSSATWISLRGDAGGTLTNAVQGRWR